MAEQPTAGESNSALATGLALLARIEQSLIRLEHSVEQIHVDIATLKVPAIGLPPQAEGVPAERTHARDASVGMPDVALVLHDVPPVDVAVQPLVQETPVAQAPIPVAVAVPGISITPEQAAVLAQQMAAAERLRQRFSGDAPETPGVGSGAPSPAAREAACVMAANGQETPASPWYSVGTHTFFAVTQGTEVLRNQPLRFASPRRVGAVRFEAVREGSLLPQNLPLSVQYIPQNLYVLLQGAGPYTLGWSGKKVGLQDAAGVGMLLQGNAEIPTVALGPETAVQGAGTVQAPVQSTEFGTYALWAMLGIASLALGGMALQLLRTSQKEQPPKV